MLARIIESNALPAILRHWRISSVNSNRGMARAIEKSVICVCTRTEDDVYEKMISNMREVEARHGHIIAVATDGDAKIASVAQDVIYVPDTPEEFSPIVNVVALQLLAYYAAHARGTDIDKPRNLAKSVTVE